MKSPIDMASVDRHGHTLIILLFLLAFAVPFTILYYLNPSAFEATWKGRTYYLFFIWLICLEAILGWDDIKQMDFRFKSIRFYILAAVSALPTVYVILDNYGGLGTAILEFSQQHGISQANLMPVAVEYLAFMILFVLIEVLALGITRVSSFSISAVFLATIGAIYMIDNLYPNGSFTPFQVIVPTTANLAGFVLSSLGYQVMWHQPMQGMPTFRVISPTGSYSNAYSIAWPCSGVESLIIYALTILLFLRKSDISRPLKATAFVAGAAVTYFVNALRISTIFMISANGGDIWSFHNYWGQLYSMSWILTYPLVILGIQRLFELRKTK